MDTLTAANVFAALPQYGYADGNAANVFCIGNAALGKRFHSTYCVQKLMTQNDQQILFGKYYAFDVDSKWFSIK